MAGSFVDPVSVRVRVAGTFVKPKSMWRRVSGVWTKLWAALTIDVSATSTTSVPPLSTRKWKLLTAMTDSLGNTYSWSIVSDTSVNGVTLSNQAGNTIRANLLYPTAEPDAGAVSIQLVVTGPDAGTYTTSFMLG